MAKKKRKRRRPRAAAAPTPAGGEGEERPAAAPSRRRPADGPPPAPWGSFPLSELVVLVGIVLLFAGFFVEPPRGPVMIGAGLVLGSLAGLELSIREHFSGYRSHTVLLAGAAGMATLIGLLTLTGIHPAGGAAAAVLVFGLAAWLLANAFRNRSGGALFRIRS
jgi:hypothetical protein